MFNIDLIDLFYECKDSNIGNYADDTTPYAHGENIRAVILKLQSLAFRLFKLFQNNHMKANPGKSHIFLSTKKTEKLTINDVVLTSSVEERLLGITLNSERKFEKHVKGICNKASQKIHVLSRITSYMSLNKRILLMKTFVESQFNYSPLIRMFHYRRLNNKINNGTEKISFLTPKVWALVPGKIKECSCLEAFKSKSRKWKPDCPCRLCKTYLQHIGLL